jgi:hypothetical protein
MKTTLTLQRPGYGCEIPHLNRRHTAVTTFGRIVLLTCCYEEPNRYSVYGCKAECWDSAETPNTLLRHVLRELRGELPKGLKLERAQAIIEYCRKALK